MVPLALRSAVAACLAWTVAGCEVAPSYEALTGPAAAAPAPAERPSFTVGDEFWFDTGDRSIIVEVFDGEEDGLLVFRRSLQSEARYYTPDLALARIWRPFGTDQWFKPDNGMLEFPLTVAKTWVRSFRVVSSGSAHTVERTRSCQAVDTGQVSVPAGSFAAFRIECTLRELGSARVVEEEYFYAPAVGRIILYRTHDGGSDIRLTEFTRVH